MIETCTQCGWQWDKNVTMPTAVENWPPELPKPPPLPDTAHPHPAGSCPCHLTVGQAVFWDLGASCPDLPPVRGVFLKTDSFEGPEFALVDNLWVKTSDPVAKCVIKIDKDSVHPWVLKDFPDLLDPEYHVVFLEDLTDLAKWPVIVPKE